MNSGFRATRPFRSSRDRLRIAVRRRLEARADRPEPTAKVGWAQNISSQSRQRRSATRCVLP